MERDKIFRIDLKNFAVELGENDRLIFSEKPQRGVCPPIHENALTLSQKMIIERRRNARNL